MFISNIRKKLWLFIAVAIFVALLIIGKEQGVFGKAQMPKLASSFSSLYSLIDLRSVPRLPPAYGGLTFKAGDANTILIGGLAGTQDAGIYSVKVRRDRDNHIIAFGAASFVAKSPGIGKGGIDAALTYSPKKDVLFYTSYDDNSIGQIKLGSKAPNKQIDLTSLGIAVSTGALTFVPDGFSGAGSLKITSYTTNTFFDTTISPDKSGTYDIARPSRSVKLDGGLDALTYIKAGNPGFSQDSLLIAEYDTNNVSAYAIDANGNPIAATRKTFITGIAFHSPTALTGTIASTVDPLTGDVLYSTFFENEPSKSKIIAVRGFKK